MTLCAAVEHEGAVHVACDSFLGTTATRDAVAAPKWFTRGGLVIAFAGGVDGAQAVRHAPRFRRLRKGEDPEAYLVTVVAAAIRAALARVGYARTTTTDPSPTEFLVALAGRAWVIQEDLSVIRSLHGYTAIGAGADVALGALAATEGRHPRDRLERALAAAERHCTQVTAPFAFTVVAP